MTMAGLPAFQNTAVLIAKTGIMYTIECTLIASVIRKVTATIIKTNQKEVLRTISLNNDTVQKRIDKMADDTEKNLSKISRNIGCS